jgi:hypothetical protein
VESYRAEGHGLLSLATLLNLMSKFFHSPLQPITIWCNNLSVMQTINSLITPVRPVFPSDTLRPSGDIFQATRRTFQAHPSLSLQDFRVLPELRDHHEPQSVEEVNIAGDEATMSVGNR